MASNAQRKPNYSRRIFWLTIFVVLLFSGYSAGWFYVANLVEDRATTAIAGLNRDGVTAACDNPTARGFPFRIGLFCDRVAFADAGQGIGLAAGGFRSIGQIYDPFRVIAELDGPANIALPQEAPLTIDWANLRASARLTRSLPERVSLEGKAMTVALGSAAPLASVADLQVHLRPNGQDLDLATSFDGLAVDARLVEGRKLPVISGQSDLSIKNGIALLGASQESVRGLSGTIRSASLSSGAATGMTVSGSFSVDGDGLVDAELTLTVRDPKALSALLAEAFPEAREQIVSGFSGLAALGPEPTLPLRVAKGKATVGFIPLGAIPPLK